MVARVVALVSLFALSGCMTSEEVRGLAEGLNSLGGSLQGYSASRNYGGDYRYSGAQQPFVRCLPMPGSNMGMICR